MPDKQSLNPDIKWSIIDQRLKGLYGLPEWRKHLEPVDELVNTILSQNTSDTNRDKAFIALKARYPEWDMVLAAPEGVVQEVIRPAGLSNKKAPRIKEALASIKGERGEISLDFLEEMSLEDARSWLTNLKGVGPKTAAIVLLFAFNRPAFPVDTHVYRLSKRLGLIDETVSVEKAHDLLEVIVNEADYYAYHLNLIRHGREICTARNPKCHDCPLQNVCNYYVEFAQTAS